jgi:hypothetical protein
MMTLSSRKAGSTEMDMKAMKAAMKKRTPAMLGMSPAMTFLPAAHQTVPIMKDRAISASLLRVRFW